VVAAFPVASSGRIPAGLVGSGMLAETAITGVAAVQLWNNATWTTIGTFTFSAGVQPILSGAPVADLPVIEGTHRLRVIATNPWTKAGLEVRLKQL
jgi:anti-sigma factor RsiW